MSCWSFETIDLVLIMFSFRFGPLLYAYQQSVNTAANIDDHPQSIAATPIHDTPERRSTIKVPPVQTWARVGGGALIEVADEHEQAITAALFVTSASELVVAGVFVAKTSVRLFPDRRKERNGQAGQ